MKISDIAHKLFGYNIKSRRDYIDAEAKSCIDFVVVYLGGIALAHYLFNVPMSPMLTFGALLVPLSIYLYRLIQLNKFRKEYWIDYYNGVTPKKVTGEEVKCQKKTTK